MLFCRCIFHPKPANHSDTITPVVHGGFRTWRIVAIDPFLTFEALSSMSAGILLAAIQRKAKKIGPIQVFIAMLTTGVYFENWGDEIKFSRILLGV